MVEIALMGQSFRGYLVQREGLQSLDIFPAFVKRDSQGRLFWRRCGLADDWESWVLFGVKAGYQDELVYFMESKDVDLVTYVGEQLADDQGLPLKRYSGMRVGEPAEVLREGFQSQMNIGLSVEMLREVRLQAESLYHLIVEAVSMYCDESLSKPLREKRIEDARSVCELIRMGNFHASATDSWTFGNEVFKEGDSAKLMARFEQIIGVNEPDSVIMKRPELDRLRAWDWVWVASIPDLGIRAGRYLVSDLGFKAEPLKFVSPPMGGDHEMMVMDASGDEFTVTAKDVWFSPACLDNHESRVKAEVIAHQRRPFSKRRAYINSSYHRLEEGFYERHVFG